ncbi:GGDEF domain-containing protein [Pseudomonas sp. Marseille-Q5115]|uniref:GGDEF domain-containing protein n=1 Tax=Pseudomonas sp. Marseille-Q5115 TaxID=2866593 RepID=UPI001CE49307|nr:diguanylate cyclase [Pseudomonas sp. Marseille-Q5115]
MNTEHYDDPTHPSMNAERPLAHRLVVATLVFCLVFTFATVCVRTWFAWNSGVQTMNSELALIDQVFQGSLSKAIWEMDRDSLEAQLKSVVEAAPVGRVTLRIPRPERAEEVLVRERAGFLGTGPAPVLTRALTVSPYPGAVQPVGTLVIEGDPGLLRQRLWKEVWTIMLTQIIQALALAGITMLMFNGLVTVHVRHIARHLERLTPANLADRLRLGRLGNRNDELDLLTVRINALQDNMAQYLELQHQAELALAASRDHLALEVEQRTAELVAANEQLQSLSRLDPLTGLANRRYFDELKDAEFNRALRSGRPLTVLMCDVDFFKRYNDTHGHGGGDACLRLVADTMKALFMRSGEVIARLGGEEFAVLLPGSDAAHARQAGERLREALAARQIPHGASPISPYLTVSIGIAELEPSAMTVFDQLLHRADEALYRAKNGGRNRVCE